MTPRATAPSARRSSVARAVAAALAVSLVPAAAAEAVPVVRTSPALTPGYRPSVPDYVVRCTPGRPVAVRVRAPRGTRVAVDGRRARTGAFERGATLEPGQSFAFQVRRGKQLRRHVVRCVPADFPSWKTALFGKPEVRWIAFTPNAKLQPPVGAPYSVIADSHGVPVWWRAADSGIPVNTTVLRDGSVAWGQLGGAFSQAMFTRVGLDGTPLGELTTVGVGADEHDLQQMPNGDFLMIAYVRRSHVDLTSIGGPADATVLDGDVQEIAPDGRLVWSWSTKDHIGVEETAAVGVSATRVPNADGNTFDLVHVNSVEPDGDSVLISARHLDAVYRVRRSDGAIMWKLGGTHRPESLTIKGDPYGVHGLDGQHDARRWPDGTVSVHDNGTFRVRPPRIARYRIDPRRRTATLVEQVRDRMIQSSPCCGSARRLPHGRWFVSWGGRPVIEELTPAGRPVIRLTIAGRFFSYRAQPVAPGALSRAQLRAGMDAMHPR